MRVAVCVDPMCGLSSLDAGTAIARAFSAQGDRCIVVPVGQAGRGAAESIADILGVVPRLLAVPDADVVAMAALPTDDISGPGAASDAVLVVAGTRAQAPGAGGSSWPVGAALRALLDACGDQRPARVFLDAGAVTWHDAGAGFWGALGATSDGSLRGGLAALDGLTCLDLTPARDLLSGVELVLLAPEGGEALPLIGLRGIASVQGRDRGDDLATVLAADHVLARFAELGGSASVAQTDGAGACGGLGFAVLALGGRVSTGFEVCRALAHLDASLERADLVIVGTDHLDFGHWDQFSVLPISRVVDTRVPVVAINRRTHVSQRELRTQGIESAHSLVDADADVPSASAITERVALIAASWHR